MQELPAKEVAENGFKINDSDDINKPLLYKAKLSEITIKNNFTEWHYQHLPPEKEYPNFKFYLGSDDQDSEEFCCNNFEHELKICYNIKTHLQVIKVNKVRNYNYNDMIEWITDFITHTKQFVLALFSVVSELAKDFKLSFLYLSY